MSLESKLERLNIRLESFKSVTVAYSSGVDSTFLLKAAHSVLQDNVTAITAERILQKRRYKTYYC